MNSIAKKSLVSYFGGLEKFKVLMICCLGNFLELYDYVLFVVMLPIISQKFFPANDPNTSVIIGMLTFAVSFVFVSFGSIFWGWYADKFGRVKLLKLSMFIMSVPSLTIAFLPDYNTIGITAPIILILARIVQGISASGEVQGAKIYAMETVAENSVGAAGGMLSAAGGLGVFMAMATGYIIANNTYEDAWRIPFLVGSVIGYVGLYFRRDHIKQKFADGSKVAKRNMKIGYLVNILKEYKSESIAVFALGGILGAFSYMLHAFMSHYLGELGYTKSDAYLLIMISLVATAITSVIAGFACDRNKNEVGIITKNIIQSSIAIIPFFILIGLGNLTLTIISFIVIGGLLGVYASVCGIIMFKAFPFDVRCRGVMFLYAFSVAIFGGFAPVILKYLSIYHALYPPIFMLIVFGSMYMIFIKYFNKIKQRFV